MGALGWISAMFGVWCAAMRRLFYFTFCTGCMVGFWYFVSFMVTGISEDFGDGFACGVMMIVVIMWSLERMGLIRIVEPEKGIWIPHEISARRDGDR